MPLQSNIQSYAARARRVAAGMCRTHGSVPQAPGKKECQPCLWDRQEHNLRYFFGITVEEYAWMEHAQDRKCKICRGRCPTGKDLAVDHDHKTGHVRGLLCTNCNQAIGKLKDSAELADKVASYLRGV